MLNLDYEHLYPEEHIDLSSLVERLYEEEVAIVVFNPTKNKSLGPNGFLHPFTRGIMTPLKVMFSKTDISRWNCTYISLIPKKSECTSIKDFWPISLENRMIKMLEINKLNCAWNQEMLFASQRDFLYFQETLFQEKILKLVN